MKTQNQKRLRKEAKFPSLLDEVLERRVLLYTLAAGATLAVASAAQAKVVFTPSNAVLKSGFDGNRLQIDLNNDGVTDFTLVSSFNGGGSSTYAWELNAIADGYNRIGVRTSFRAAGLRRGIKIESSDNFAKVGVMVFKFIGSYGGTFGSFWNSNNLYLGVEILMSGQVHYGWIGFRRVGFHRTTLTATLAGWAYETVPNKAIRAGDEGLDDSAISGAIEPTSLELLAAGHVAVAERRRRIAA